MTETRERFCPHCGRANPAQMPRCMNCGQRVGGTVLLAETEEGTQRAGWWQTSEASVIPPPPQVREQIARQEAAMREKERLAEEQRRFQERLEDERKRSAERLATIKEKRQERLHPSTVTVNPPVGQTKQVVCHRCQSPLGQAGHHFSFCLNCGADTNPETKSVSATASVKGTMPMAGTGATQSTRNVSVAGPTFRVGVQTTERSRNEVNPAVAGFLSFLFPGIGQFINGQPTKGAVLLLALFVAMVIFKVSGVILLVGRGIAALDAYRIAERRRRGGTVREDEWDLGG